MNKKSIILIMIILLLALGVIFVAKSLIGNDIDENQTFNATVLENMGTSILVQPNEGEDELSSSDKIVVGLLKDNSVFEDLSQFTVGSKVKITYDGLIRESYPAQITASKIEFIK